MNKSIEPVVIAQSSERLFRAACDDAVWLEQLQRWAEQGLMLVQSNPRAVSKEDAQRMMTRIFTIMRIAEDAISGEAS